jgi:hypothetical protein
LSTSTGFKLPTWVFDRDGVTIAIQRVPPFAIHVESSERQRRQFSFSTIDELTAFQCGFEAHLLETGWSLVAFGPERRDPDDLAGRRAAAPVERRRYPLKRTRR